MAPASSVEPTKQAIEFYNQGIDLYQTGNVQKSIELFQSAITECPDFYEAYYNLAQIQYATNRLDDAINTYEKIATLRPEDEENIYYLARSLYKRGYLTRAMSYYRQLTPECVYYDDAKAEMEKLSARQAELRQESLKKAEEYATIQTPWVKDNVVIQKNVTETPKVVEKPIEPTKKTEVILEDNKIIKIQSFEDELLKSNVSMGDVNPVKLATIEGVKAPAGIAVDSAGNAYVASFSDNAIYKINNAMAKTVFATGGNIEGPVGVAVDKFDNIYVANYTKGNIIKISQKGVVQEIATVKNPYFMTIRGENLYVSEQVSNTVLKFKLY